MRVSPIINNQVSSINSNTGSVSFGTYNPTLAKKLETELAQRGFKCDVRGNDFVGECYKKTVNVFQKLFGKSLLPANLMFESLGEGVFGVFNCDSNKVSMNKDYSYGCFYDMDHLKAKAKQLYRYLLPGWNSTNHPAHVFVHEFAHAAHWHHLVDRNGDEGALKVWQGLVGTTVPTGIGKLITKFKLSEYAVAANDMCEFLAERMAKDICGGLTENSWEQYKTVDVKYSDIFSRKWDYRYSSPQSYIDYFTQQVWNGDIEGAKRVGQQAEEYLKSIEAAKTSPVVDKIASALDYTPSGCNEKTKPLLFKIGSFVSKTIKDINKNVTESLDEKNKLELNKHKQLF